jgi:MFS family permease
MACVTRSRLAVSALFFINGAVLASWVPHIPAVKQAHGISDASLGLVLLAMAAGSVVALPLAGWLVARLGSRVVASCAALVFCLALPLPVVSPDLALVSMALVLLGVANATLDVSMNAQALEVEQRYGRRIMSSFHGLFSLGGVVGAAAAAVAMSVGVDDRRHVFLATAITVLVVLVVLPSLVPSVVQGRTSAGPVFARPGRALLCLGLLAFLGLLAEGAMGDWSAVYLRDALRSTPAVAASGYAAFSFAMASGRFGGDHLVNRLGTPSVLRMSGVVAASGLGAGLLIAEPRIAILGFALVGFGISNVIPLAFGITARVEGVEPGPALAAVATTGYFGFLSGPPLIGLVAEAAGLPAALGIVSASCALIAVCAGGVSQRRRAAGASASTV